jgi:hypothetical protein
MRAIRQGLLLILVAMSLFAIVVILIGAYVFSDLPSDAVERYRMYKPLTEVFVPLCVFAPLPLLALASICAIFALVTHGRAAGDTSMQKGQRLPMAVYKILLLPAGAMNVLMTLATVFLGAISWILPPLGPILGVILAPYTVIAVVVGCLLGVMLLLATSAFTISAILHASACRALRKSQAALFIILQLLPLVDVISWPPILRSIKRQELASRSFAPFIARRVSSR